MEPIIELVDGVRLLKSKMSPRDLHSLLQCDTHIFDKDIAKRFNVTAAYGHPNVIKAFKKKYRIRLKSVYECKQETTLSAPPGMYDHNNGSLKRSFISMHESKSALTSQDFESLLINYRCLSCGDVWEKEDCKTVHSYVYCPICNKQMVKVRD